MIKLSNIFAFVGSLFLLPGLLSFYNTYISETDGLASSYGTMGSGFIITSSIFFVLFTYQKNQDHKNSEFYLNKCIEGFKKSLELLEDGNNDRVTWILAARLLTRSTELIPLITESSHKKVLELVKDENRVNFHYLLENENIYPSFFAGSLFPSETLEDARKAQKEIYEAKYINEPVLKIIYDFSKYPKDYNDPLSKGKFTEEEFIWMELTHSALAEYIFSRRDKFWHSGAKSQRTKQHLPKKPTPDTS